ncbi:glutamate--cysteine ligase [Methylomagnum sp.]
MDRLKQAGQEHLLRNGLKGLEKESLRLAPDGTIAQTPHPAALGSALTHPWITTDYSEALIELITPPCADPADTMRYLEDLHVFVYSHLGEEFLLSTSMPVGLAEEESIPIARYGNSNIGLMKHIYRRGLAYRYGRTMQAIAGVHFNYSVNEALWPVLQALEGNTDPLPKFIADAYFGAIRSIHRYGWLLIYLFGCSPAVCKSFFTGREELATAFMEFDQETLYRPHATSLRMSDIGYRNDNQASLDISLDNLDAYIANLTEAINRPYPPYEQIGVKVDGEYRQLNANILQIENEYYSPVRPKQITKSGEKPTLALKRRGVRYLELRALDLNCFEPTGLGLDELRFLEVFVLFCVLADSPFLNADEKAEANRNSLSVACCSRTPSFRLLRFRREISLPEWAGELLSAMTGVADALDADDPQQPYTRSLGQQKAIISNLQSTPSARLLAEMRGDQESFPTKALNLSWRHANYWRRLRLEANQTGLFQAEAEASWTEQKKIEAMDRHGPSFEVFLKRYFAQGKGPEGGMG